MNLVKLKNTITDRGVKVSAIADAAGMSRFTLYKKLAGESEFTVSEIAKMSEFLRLSREERDEIFFDTELSNT